MSCSCKMNHNHEHEHSTCACVNGHESHEQSTFGCSCGCGCGHNHGEIKKRQWKVLVARCLVTVLLFVTGFVFEKYFKNSTWLIFVFFGIAYLIISYDIIKTALKNIFHGRIFDENFLMITASLGAMIIGESAEGIAVMMLFQIGETLQDYAVAKSRKSISSLLDIRPDFATVLKDGIESKISVKDVKIGDEIIVRPGEKIPVDGKVIDGCSFVDTSSLTGESMPRETKIGDEVFSGCINTDGLLKVQTLKLAEESTASKILDMVENASSKKAVEEKFISKFAKVYTPIVVVLAIIIAITGIENSIYKALMFLVVSCPCALVISVPLSFFAGLGTCSRKGVLVKGSNYFQVLNQVKNVAMDKTGTLTNASFVMEDIHTTSQIEKEKLITIAAHAEKYSNHPVAISLKEMHKCDECDLIMQNNVTEISGKGIKVYLDGKNIFCGNEKLMLENDIEGFDVTCCECNDKKLVGSIIHIAVDGKYLGHIIFADRIKKGAENFVAMLKKEGVEKTFMLTGDTKDIAQKVAKEVGVDFWYNNLLPQDKVKKVEEIKKSGKTLFVGDGINDSPVLAISDVGVAMGGIGSDAAIEAADIVIMGDELEKIPYAMRVARKTLFIVKENIIFTISMKIIILILATLGFASMWWAVFADVGVCLIAVLNSLRVIKTK